MSLPAVHPDPDDAARRPRTFGQRLQLLLVLLILPIAAVALPTIFVTGIFGQRPQPKTAPHASPTPAPRPAATPDTSGLAGALNLSAEKLLPVPSPLTPEPILLKVRADHVAARAEKVARQAQALGGSATEGVVNPGEQHLFVDLPAGNDGAFRRALTENTVPTAPAETPALGAAHDRLEVIIRPAADDE